MLYTCELNKIDYINNHCKNIVFEIIKSKVTFIFANAYFICSKIIQDLQNLFIKFDKVAKLNVLLYDPKFEIIVINSK